MALTLRYSEVGNLKMVHTGNTMGMSANSTYCATGITLNSNLNSGVGITSSFAIDTYAGTSSLGSVLGSWAYLNPDTSDVPVGSIVRKAILTVQAYSPAPTGNITLIDSTSVAHTVTLNWTDSYSAAADVTTIVANAGFGKYAVTSIAFASTYDVHGLGWGILISYSHPAMPIRSVNMYTGFIQNGGSAVATGLNTPAAGPVKARVYAQAVEANYFAGGDTLTLAGKNLSGPYNPATNFFNNQVCNYTGERTTVGSFAQYNVPQQLGPTPYTGNTYARDMFDITNVNADGAIANGATSATMAIGSSGDVLFLGMAGIEINANQAYLTPTKYVDKAIASVNNKLIYTLVVVNEGGTNALTTFVQDTLPSQVTLNPNSLTINGVPSAGNIETGISLGSLPYGTVVTLTYSVTINPNTPVTDTISNFAYTSTTFRSIANGPIYTSGLTSNTVNTNLFVDNTTLIKIVDKASVTTGDTITYSIGIYNNDTTNSIANITFVDSIPNTTSFIPNSFTIDGVTIAGANPQTGVFLNITIPPQNSSVVTFKVLTNGTIGTIPNTSTVNYNLVLPTTVVYNNSLFSNTVESVYKYVQFSINKITNKEFATTGDTIVYTIVAQNIGNTAVTNSIFVDTIPNGTSFITNSFSINNSIVNGAVPMSGINIGGIGVNEIVTLSFQVQVQ